MENQEAYNRAKERLEKKRGFKIHLIVYLAVSAFFILINLSQISSQSRNDYWFYWPMLGWGIGVFFHGMSTYVFHGMFAVTDEKIKKEMEKGSR
ncbi:MAG: 2TM domain-containing protein [Bacteroidia bacterium]|nr:2TM domain-containing protein [Bacteroidia bacterium]NNC84965.1 2TM domain-containing protein [Bacteroidia bacterium]NNM15159.1 2TM domain-containing protein [Bacteroidia bacterium]